MIERIAIVNRGEPARRLIRAVRELSAEHRRPLKTVALHTHEERRATFVREADERVMLRRTSAANPYLDHDELERALVESRADAVWVGWGFVAEDPNFVEMCDRLGITFIGPTAEVMRRLGDKISAKTLAEEVGVPVAAWSDGPVESEEDAKRHAAEIGYPLMIKAAAGGGGRGIRIVENDEELVTAFTRAREEAGRSFGDPTVFLEKVVSDARHVEVQIISDHHGAAWALGVRDCSIQRRSQKLLEESASPCLTAEQSDYLRKVATDLVLAAGYRNAGTVEFLYTPEDESFAFLEVNTRLQVEHPVTEITTGADLVKLQIAVAEGEPLEGEMPEERGHAIEARLNAEDPERGFAPAPGEVELLALPTGPGVRVDAGFSEGDTIPADYDSMIAKVIAWGKDRSEARARLQRALTEMSVVIRGGATNRSFLLDLLDNPAVIDATADTAWLNRRTPEELISDEHAGLALIAAAIDADAAEERIEREAFQGTARRGRPKADPTRVREVELKRRGVTYTFRVSRINPETYHVSADSSALDVTVERLSRFESRFRIGDETYRVLSVRNGPDYLVEVNGIAHRVSRDEGGLVRAPAPALIVDVAVSVGDEVFAGDTVIVLESMKMETSIAAPFDGVIAAVLAAENTQIDAGGGLVNITPASDQASAPSGEERVSFGGLATAPPADRSARYREQLSRVRSLFLGFDVGEEEANELVRELERIRSSLAPEDQDTRQAELELLTIFTDVAELSRNRPPIVQVETVHSPREDFHRYLRSLDPEREGIPEPLQGGLARVLEHYGVENFDPTLEHAEAAYRIFLAQERAESQVPAVLTLLDWLSRDTPEEGAHADELRDVLDRLVVATEIRHPAVGELARRVRFSLFDRPRVAQERVRTYDDARRRLEALAKKPAGGSRQELMDAVLASPQPLLPLLAERYSGDPGEDEPLLEVLTRRYYKIRELSDLESVTGGGHTFVSAIYPRDGRRVRLLATLADDGCLDAALAALMDVALGGSADRVVADLYVHWRDSAVDQIVERVTAAVAAMPGSALFHRLAVSIVAGDDGETLQHMTFRPGAQGLVEEIAVRGLHPMIARRLQYWRLGRFDVSQLEASHDTYLFHCASPKEDSDSRLVALAEVRDLTVARDLQGRLNNLPEVEHVLANSLDGIRRARAERPQTRRLAANQVFLYVWPAVDVSVDEIVAVARSLAPMTAGLGLEEVLLHFTSIEDDVQTERTVAFSYQPGTGAAASLVSSPMGPLEPVDGYAQRVRSARRRGTAYPYELAPLVAGPGGTFVEHDLNEKGRLEEVVRQPGQNTAGIIVGVASTPTKEYPEGVTRVVLFGDPTRSLGSVAEPECARILAALDLAENLGVPVEWYALSSGAKISRDSGTENMDWVAAVLRRLITFTQDGGEVNIVVAGINVGAQPYWNAEATMLMHTRGILVMTPDSAMVLTGKQALDYSGGVSAEDNFGIGGFDRIMGPNGQAQYWAPNLAGAHDLLMRHYSYAYAAKGERFPRRAPSTDPSDRNITQSPHSSPGSDLATVGDIFSSDANPERKKAFDIRSVIHAVADHDFEPLERWQRMADAETGVVMDARLGGHAVSIIGVESTPIQRHGFLPADGPDQWTAGTLFPLSSKKVARGINAASGNRPVVVLANLSGFDGSPESLRKGQLEYGAEIGRAVVNFDGPIVFCVISRYHGGAFVVFSAKLNDDMQVLAVEGSKASVIGGAPAAAVVFARDVDSRTRADTRIVELEQRIQDAEPSDEVPLRQELVELTASVRSEKLREVAAEFDGIHSIERAQRVGSVHSIVPASRLRPELIEAIERGMERQTRSRIPKRLDPRRLRSERDGG